jgi:SAM-dependent methyltransferase
MKERPVSPAFLNNHEPIAEQLEPLLERCQSVLEVGGGLCNHAEFFAERHPHLTWRVSEIDPRYRAIAIEALEARQLPNLHGPLALDLYDERWEVEPVDLIFSANVLHIAPKDAGARLFLHASRALVPGGVLFVYGPFRYRERELEPSNLRFERHLQETDPARGIRVFEELDEVASAHGLRFERDIPMPSNNHVLVWRLSA